ncbi:MAG TPA: hypothetical protein VFK91_06410 [Methyloceanibacter sp.]|nr:hypothetical protein [Methyloceanibacter sp.]
MRSKILLAAGLAAGLALPASAEAADYTMSPAGPVDTRNSFVAPVNSVFVVDNAKGQISMCFPDNKDGKILVVCTPATKLP